MLLTSCCKGGRNLQWLLLPQRLKHSRGVGALIQCLTWRRQQQWQQRQQQQQAFRQDNDASAMILDLLRMCNEEEQQQICSCVLQRLSA